MTTNWTVPPDLFGGETVAVLCPGPDMTAELAASVRQYKRIAVNRAVKFAPDADLFVALDPEHHVGVQFSGLRVVGIGGDTDALYAGLMYETVKLGPSHTISIRNNLLAAMRIAANGGAAKILLLGCDPVRYERLHDYRGLVEGLEQMTAELRAKGIEVERVEAPVQVPGRAAAQRSNKLSGPGPVTTEAEISPLAESPLNPGLQDVPELSGLVPNNPNAGYDNDER